MRYIIICVTFCAALLSATKAHAIIEITGITNASVFTEPGMPPQESPDGAIDLTAEGNAGPFTFLWSNGATTEDIQYLASGTYRVTVTNAFGCTKVLQATVKTCEGNSSTVPVIKITESTIIPASPFSPLQNDAGINITVTSTLGVSSGELFFKWTNQATHEVVSASEDLVGVTAGTYCVEITGRCATLSKCFTIPPCSYAVPGGAFNLAFTSVSPCPKQPGGSIDLSVSGVPSPFSYVWSNGATTQDISGVAAGTYIVKVTDGNGCSYSEAYALRESITEVVLSGIRHYCSENAKGEILITPSPFALYNYTWSNGVTSQGVNASITGLQPGQYCVSITNPVTNCSTSKCFTIADGLPEVGVFFESVTNTFCPENTGDRCEGIIDVSVNTSISGAGPFTYSFSGPGGYSQVSVDGVVRGLCQGTYTVVVTNSAGCTAEKSVELCCCPGSHVDPGECFYEILGDVSYGSLHPLTISAVGLTPPTPATNMLGSISLTIANGSYGSGSSNGGGPLYFHWTKEGDPAFSATTGSLINVPHGVYCVTVTDGCKKTSTCFILENYITNTVVKPSCPGGENGKITISFTPNTPKPVNLQWSGGTAYGITAESYTISELAPGTYTVTITNANNFFYFVTAIVKEEETNEAYGWPFSIGNFRPLEAKDQCLDNQWPFPPNAKIVVHDPCVNSVEVNGPLPQPFNLSIRWPDYTYGYLTINTDGSCEVSGQTNYDVNDEDGGTFDVILTDDQGCRMKQCFEFGKSHPVPVVSVENIRPFGTPYQIPAISGYNCCGKCTTGTGCGNQPTSVDCDGHTDFEFSPTNEQFPCTSGGIISLKCPGNVVEVYKIPPYYQGIEYIDWANPETASDGVCRYNVGCLFNELPITNTETAQFFEPFIGTGTPLYVTTELLLTNPTCTTPVNDGGGVSFDIRCPGGVTYRVQDPLTCSGIVVCNLTQSILESNVYFEDFVDTCYITLEDGRCILQRSCLLLDPEMNVISELEVDCPTDITHCSMARPASERAGQGKIIRSIDNDYLKVFPNPFSETYTLLFGSQEKGYTMIYLTDVTGRIIQADKIPTSEGVNNIQITADQHLRPGTYFIRLVKPDGNQAVKPLIKS